MNLIATEIIDALSITHKEIRAATARDKVLSKVLSYVNENWPNSIDKEDSELQSYFRRREELTTHQRVVIWGIRVIVPQALRQRLLKSLHETHAG